MNIKNNLSKWWETARANSIADAIGHINEAKYKKNIIEKFSSLSKAANKLWTEYNYQNNLTKGDTASFEALLRNTLSYADKAKIADSLELMNLVKLEPKIMDHYCLNKNHYNPENISKEHQKAASEKHRELIKKFNICLTEKTDEKLNQIIKKLADLLFVVRSNIAHGEKTINGPDFKKNFRDKMVCETAVPVMKLIFDSFFNQPDNRLAVYGTLKPEGSKHYKISSIDGTWINASLTGRIYSGDDSLPYFMWDLSGDNIKVKIVESSKLPDIWLYLDNFEGKSYKRIWVLANTLDNKLIVANIYASNKLQ